LRIRRKTFVIMDVMENIVIDPELASTLENYRKKALFLFVLYVVLASIVGLAGFALIPVSLILEGVTELIKGLSVALGFVLFLGGTPLFVFLALHAKNHYLKEFEDTFSPRFAEGHYEEFHFSFKKDLSDLEKKVSLPLREKPDEDHASYYEGKVSGLPFFSFSYSHMSKRARAIRMRLLAVTSSSRSPRKTTRKSFLRPKRARR
jgi:hypothetical protein